MYVLQVAMAILIGVGTFVWMLSTGVSAPVAFFFGFLATLVGRIGLATLARTRWWLRRGTQGIYTEYCPNCRGRRYRGRGDWILTCHTCGWRPGWPVVRWFTRSVPAIQLRRSIRDYRIWVYGAVGVGVLATIVSYLSTLPVPELPSFDVLMALVVLLAFLTVLALFPKESLPRWRCQDCGLETEQDHKPAGCPECGNHHFKQIN